MSLRVPRPKIAYDKAGKVVRIHTCRCGRVIRHNGYFWHIKHCAAFKEG